MTCSIIGCSAEPYGRGWCRPHYMSWYKNGDPEAAKRRRSFPGNLVTRLRFMENGCVEFMGASKGGGYTYVRRNGRNVGAHRAAYELLVGPIPTGLVIDHLCRNRACVNPSHLEAVTGAENTLRGIGPTATNARKTHCIHGHEFTAENIVAYRGARLCRTCKNAATRELRRRKREAA